LAERGVPVEVIRQVAGHSSITVTERYCRMRPDAAADHVHRAFG
jgi:site-specific recombinase XerD